MIIFTDENNKMKYKLTPTELEYIKGVPAKCRGILFEAIKLELIEKHQYEYADISIIERLEIGL